MFAGRVYAPNHATYNDWNAACWHNLSLSIKHPSSCENSFLRPNRYNYTEDHNLRLQLYVIEEDKLYWLLNKPLTKGVKITEHVWCYAFRIDSKYKAFNTIFIKKIVSYISESFEDPNNIYAMYDTNQ